MAKKNGGRTIDLSKLNTLLKEYDRVSSEREMADNAAAVAQARQSDTVKKIHELVGTDPIVRKDGRRLMLMVRPSDKEAEKLRSEGRPVPEKRYFFRSEGAGGIDAGV